MGHVHVGLHVGNIDWNKDGFFFIIIISFMQVVLVPYFFLFCVLSNDMLNVSIATFFRRFIQQHKGSSKKNCTPHLCHSHNAIMQVCLRFKLALKCQK